MLEILVHFRKRQLDRCKPALDLLEKSTDLWIGVGMEDSAAGFVALVDVNQLLN